MTWLKRIGGILLKVGEIAMGVSPILASAYPKQAGGIQVVSQDLAELGNIIVMIEAAGQALNIAGPDKLKAAAPLVAQAILRSALVANHKIENQALFQGGSVKIADGLVDILNSFHASVETVATT